MRHDLLAALPLLAAASTATATVLHVPSQYPSVEAAFRAAAAGDTVQLAAGRYAETGLEVPGGVTLLGDPADAPAAWLDGSGNDAILTIPAGAARIRIVGVGFRNGRPGLRVAAGPARHEIVSCTFQDNEVGLTGAGFAACGCRFEGNTVRPGAVDTPPGGGAIHSAGGEIRDCTFVGNRALGDANGGAVYLGGLTAISGCVFLRNTAESDGGAVYVRHRMATLDHCRFLGNSAFRGGGAYAYAAHLTVRSCSFLRNSATKGGAILCPSDTHRTLTLESTVIQETLAGGALAYAADALTPTLVRCDLFGNAGGDWVGAIAAQYPRNDNLAEDARFCDTPEDSLFVAADSPLLASNNRAGTDIGATRVGCHGPGVLVASDPPGIPIRVDGVTYAGPKVFDWTPGSLHALDAPAQLAPEAGVRFDLVGWSDGGAPAHSVVAPEGSAEFVAAYRRSFLVTLEADVGGTVEPGSAYQAEGAALTLRATADTNAVFAGWTGSGDCSYTGPDPVREIRPRGPVVQRAHFYKPPAGEVFAYIATATEGGIFWPASGEYAPGATVSIGAMPRTGYRFLKWQGMGQHSYSGQEPEATVTFHSDVTQHAIFERDESRHGAEFSLSTSDTDPFRNADVPTGEPRTVYLWLTCAQEPISAFECGVESSVPLLTAFAPAERVVNVGTGTDLMLGFVGCADGDARLLGHWIVMDTGGRMCLTVSRKHGLFVTVDCGSLPSMWPDPVARGFASDGLPPCVVGGNGCGPFAAATTGSPVTAGRLVNGITAVAPNPFRGLTEVRFSLARPGAARVTVYDVAGRLVRVLREGELPAGSHSVTWDGRGAASEVAGAGVYFVRFEGNGVLQTRRVVSLGGRKPE